MAAPNKTRQINYLPKPTVIGYINSHKTTVSGVLEAMGVATEEVGVVTGGMHFLERMVLSCKVRIKNANTLPFQQQWIPFFKSTLELSLCLWYLQTTAVP